MKLGKMRHQLKLYTIGRTQDAGGGYARADTAGDTIWAHVMAATPRESQHYEQLQKRVTHKATVRYSSDFRHGMRIDWLRPSAHGGTVSLYLEGFTDADPGGRTGEFQRLLLREGGEL